MQSLVLFGQFFQFFLSASDTEGGFKGFCSGLSHTLHRNPFPTISLGCFHHLTTTTTKNPFVDFNVKKKDCSALITMSILLLK